MNIKATLAVVTCAVVTFQTAYAGTWANAKAPIDKCPIDDCPDIGGNVSVGYLTDYVFKGVRFARDSMWGDVNYTFDNLPFTPNVGIWHLTDLNDSRATSFYGDQTNAYASIGLPSIFGFESSIGYTHYFYPTARPPAGGIYGDSLSEVTATLARELVWGIVGVYSADYRWGNGDGGWMHTFGLSKDIHINDCVGLRLTGGVLYNDNYWKYARGSLPASQAAYWAYQNLNGVGNVQNGNWGNDSGWHSYYVGASLPIQLNCRATLTPFVQYNGTPDGWTGDGMYHSTFGGLFPASMGLNANHNDVFFGGISLSVDF